MVKIKTLEKNRYSIITDNMDECYICGRPATQKHEVIYGRNRKNSMEDGLVIPLCMNCHTGDNGVHNNKKLDNDLHQLAEIRWLKHYNKTIEDFIKRYGRNYVDK
jgi:hypothetical protein